MKVNKSTKISTSTSSSPSSSSKGDLSQRRNQRIGPFEIYLPTGRRGPDNRLITEEVENENGQYVRVPEKESEPFLTGVYFRKNSYSLKVEDDFTEMAQEKYANRPFLQSVMQLLRTVVSWDLVDNGVPVELTVEDIKEHEVDPELVNAINSRYMEIVRVPLEPTQKSQATSSQEEQTDDSQESID